MTGEQKLLATISSAEGFTVRGSIPNRRNNPGDLRHGPNAQHGIADPVTGQLIGPDDIGLYETLELGQSDAIRQFRLDADRGMTVEQFVFTYAPPSENNSHAYLQFVCAKMGCQTFDFLRDVLARDYPDEVEA